MTSCEDPFHGLGRGVARSVLLPGPAMLLGRRAGKSITAALEVCAAVGIPAEAALALLGLGDDQCVPPRRRFRRFR